MPTLHRVQVVVCFNSRTPGGVRPHGEEHTATSSCVSIHAPREGCDLRDTAKLRSRYCFNSRTPGGVRQTSTLPDPLRGMFQFTHPGRGATIHKLEAYLRGEFQFTHPGRGATTALIPSVCLPISFNSRTPGGVRLYSFHSCDLRY